MQLLLPAAYKARFPASAEPKRLLIGSPVLSATDFNACSAPESPPNFAMSSSPVATPNSLKLLQASLAVFAIQYI
ncbi:hypothetical protein, partial [Treponema phagedenis]|uniref:hypothetical protein n=1 Tax=Treponema phagedenis TaxID=162 RepID=UPI001E65ABC0